MDDTGKSYRIDAATAKCPDVDPSSSAWRHMREAFGDSAESDVWRAFHNNAAGFGVNGTIEMVLFGDIELDPRCLC